MTAKLFIAYKNTPIRRELVANPGHRPENYQLWGIEKLKENGWQVSHNLGPQAPSNLAQWLNRRINKRLKKKGAPGGDWMSILSHLTTINRSDIVFSTVDNVGIPLAVLKWLRIIRPPIIYTSIGFLEKFDRITSTSLHKRYQQIFRTLERCISYSMVESELLTSKLGLKPNVSCFIPLGVMDSFFYPEKAETINWDIISIGSDSRRDFSLLIEFAKEHPERKVLFVASEKHAYLRDSGLPNIELAFNIPMQEMKRKIEQSRLVVLPVKPNSYTGATTTLLQAMCMGKCVIASAVEPIKRGYNLADGENCLLVEPGEYAAMETAIATTIDNNKRIESIGTAARATILATLTWQHFTDAVSSTINAVLQEKEPLNLSNNK